MKRRELLSGVAALTAATQLPERAEAMLQVTQLSGFGVRPINLTMLEAIQSVGITTGLKLCLDAADAASYTSGQKWLDTSGGGYDFFLGADVSATATDPTFNGAAGGRSSSEYWSFDGGDYFTYDTTNESWMNNLHKSGAVFGCAAWVYSKTVGAANDQLLLTTLVNTGTDTGIRLHLAPSGSGAINFQARNDGADVCTIGSGTEGLLVSNDVWSFVACKVTASTGAALYQVNATQVAEGVPEAYSSPSSGSATTALKIGSTGSGTHFASGTRLSGLSVWEGTAPSDAALLALFNATRGRFGV